MQIPVTIQAGLWGWLAASGLLIGAAIGFLAKLPQKVVASIMAYGSGVLVAALCFGQIPEAERIGGLWPTMAGLLAGGAVFVLASQYIDRLERHHRGRSSNGGSGMVAVLIAVGAFLDGIPESLGLGLGLLAGGEVSLLMLVAIFLANLPEGLASAAGLREERRSGRVVFALWGDRVVVRTGGHGRSWAVRRSSAPLAGLRVGLLGRGGALHAGGYPDP